MPYQKPYRKQEHHQFDGLTTMARDFVPFKVTKQPESRPKTAGMSMPFSAQSSYSMNFPNWGPSNVNHEKRYNEIHQDQRFRSESRTAYRETFQQPKTSLANDKKSYETFMCAKTSSINLKTTDQPLEDNTTYQKSFNVASTTPINLRVQVVSRERDDTYVSSGHFRTEHRDQYVRRPVYNDPRLTRKQLLKSFG
jgi:hypothetical protein